MPAIFISHSSRDQQVADDVKSALARLGFERVFLDFDKDTGIGAGEAWEKRLYEEVSRCHAIILVLTPNWLASTWCRVELAQARALGKVILPVICAPLGERYVLPEVQAVDLVDWNADGLERIEQRLHAITTELARGFTLDPHRPPYPGIHAFEAEDAAIYFGRDDETRAVIERLDARRTHGGARLLVIIGASGAGKSSLLKAGVLPQLGRRRSHWIVLPTMRPQKTPLEALAKIAAELRGEPQGWRSWHERLRDPEAFQQVAELAKDLRVGPARAATVLLPIDQLEELFTIAEAEERSAFLRLMAGLLDPARDLPVVAVATGRADVLQGLLEASELEVSELPRLTETITLRPMPLDRVPRLVEGPATVASLIIERGLAERIMRDVESPEALPLLAYTLRLLNDRCAHDKRLTLAAYLSLGDPGRDLNPVQNSVRLAADQAIGGLNPSAEELAALRDAFVPHLLRLRLDDGRRVRQPAPLASLPREAARLIRALTEARLLTVRAEEGEAIVEVAHEALFAAWPTLASWLDEEQAFLADIERIKSAHETWSEAPPDLRPQALLQGLQLSNARDWLVEHPRRFVGREMEKLRGFIAESGDVRDAAERERTREREDVARHLAARLAEAQLHQSRFLTSMAETAARNRDPGLAGLIARAALPTDMRKPDRPFWPPAVEVSAQVRSLDPLRAVLVGHSGAVSSAAWSPDGTRIVTASEDKTTRIWDAKTGTSLAVLKHPYEVSSVAWNPDRTRIVTVSYKTARIWDAKIGTPLAVLEGHTDMILSAAWSPDGSRMVTASADKTARIWDVESGAPLAMLDGNPDTVWRAAWSPDGALIATASYKSARIWDGKTGVPLTVLKGHSDVVHGAAWSPDGSRIVTHSSDTTARIWDAKSGALLALLQGHTNYVRGAAFSPDGQRVVTASTDHTARLWDAVRGTTLVTLKGGFLSIAWSPDGSRILTTSDDGTGTAHVWDAKSGVPLAVFWGNIAAWSPDGMRIVTADYDTVGIQEAEIGSPCALLEGHTDNLRREAWSPDGTRIVTASKDKTARIWDAKTGAPMAVLEHSDAVYSAAWNLAGSRLVTASEDKTARIWDAKTGAPLAVLEHSGAVFTAAWSPDGSRIATASYDNTARIWDAKTGAALAVLLGHIDGVHSAAWSPDESRIATASIDRTARVWDAATGKELVALRGHKEIVWSAAWSPGGSRIVTASDDGTVRVWDAKTGAGLVILQGYRFGDNRATAWSPDGSRIVTSRDKTAWIWDAKTGALLAVLKGHTEGLTSAAWNPDGSRIVTSADKAARIWDVKTGAALAVLDGHAHRVHSATWSPDGSRIVAASENGTARIWDAWPLLTADTVTYAWVSALRGLTAEERARVFLEAPNEVAPNRSASVSPAEDVAGMSVEQLRAIALAGNTYAHRRLAELYERGEGVEVSLERALFHHAVEARLFEEAGNEAKAQIARARRGSIARALTPDAAVRIAYEVMDWKPTSPH